MSESGITRGAGERQDKARTVVSGIVNVLLPVLLAASLGAQGLLQTFVLCLGADGHVALEATAAPELGCGTLSPAIGQASSSKDLLLGPQQGASHCGLCEDAVLSSLDTTYAMGKGVSQIDLPAHTSSPSALPLRSIDLRYFSSVSRSWSPASSPFLACLRTTVLLI